MFSKLQFQFILAVFITTFHCANAQNASFWSDRGDAPFTTKNMRSWIPTEYRALNLQRQNMKDFLSKVPHQNKVEVTKSTAILTLPMPDGSFQQFHLVESPVMEEGLAAKYPEIKTYLGQGIEDRAAVLRCDMTYLGFHAYILSPNGTVYISPYSLNPDGEYISYYKHNLPTSTRSFSCGMNDKGRDLSPLDGENTIQLPAPNTGNMGMKNIDNKLRTYRLALACTGEYAAYFGGTIQGALAGMVTTINRVNTVYEVDLAVHLNLIANTDDLIQLDGSSDPYTNDDGSSLQGENQDEIDWVIGSANYDIGHVFSTGGGGIASGIYFLHISTPQGTIIKKIIKE